MLSKIFRQLALAGFTSIAPFSAHAEEDFNPLNTRIPDEDNGYILASEKTARIIGPYADVLLSNIEDTIAIIQAQYDYEPPLIEDPNIGWTSPISYEETMFRYFKYLQSQNDLVQFLPPDIEITVNDFKNETVEEKMGSDWFKIFTEWYWNNQLGRASAWQVSDEWKASDVNTCVVVAPLYDYKSTKSVFWDFTHIRDIPSLPTPIHPEELFVYTLAHEFVHCGQSIQRTDSDTIKNTIESIRIENGADYFASINVNDFNKSTDKNLPARITPEYLEALNHAFQAMRSIGNLRNGSHLLDSNDPISSHLIIDQNHPRYADLDIQPADIALASSLLTTNLYLSAPALIEEAKEVVTRQGLFGLTAELDRRQTAVDSVGSNLSAYANAGHHVLLEFPEIEYALLKFMRENFLNEPLPISTTPDEKYNYKLQILQRGLIDDYMNSIETYYPRIPESALAVHFDKTLEKSDVILLYSGNMGINVESMGKNDLVPTQEFHGSEAWINALVKGSKTLRIAEPNSSSSPDQTAPTP